MLKIFMALLAIFIALFFFLTSGITIPKISIPGFDIAQFYIKLDKKLIISVDTIKIEKKNRPVKTVKEIDRIGTLVQYLPNYFHSITIKNLVIGERVFHLRYDDAIFSFDSDSFELISGLSFDPFSKILEADVKKLYIKKPGVTLTGEMIYSFRERIWRGEGEYDGFGISGNFNFSHIGKRFYFELDSKPCSSIKELVDYLDPPEKIKEWIYPKIPAKRYLLHYLKGGFILNDDGSIDFDPRGLEAFATAYNAKIRFNPKVPPVIAEKIDVTLKNDTLSFKIYKPVYEGKRVDGSYVKIRNLTNKKAELDAHIRVRDKIDESIKKILTAYGIDLPFVQTEGITDAVVDFTVALVKGRVTHYKGVYRSKYAKLLFDNVVPLPVENLHVISEGAKITILPCHVKYDPYLDANLSGSLDLHEKTGKFDTHINRLRYSYDKTDLIDMKEKSEPVLLDFKKDISFELPGLMTTIVYKKGGGVEAQVKELGLIKPYLKGVLEGIKSGRVHFGYDKSRLQLDANIVYPNEIFSISEKPIESFHIKAQSGNGQIHIRINDRFTIIAQPQRTFFNIKTVDLSLDRLLEKIEPYIDGTKKRSSESSGPSHLLYIEGHDSTLYYKRVKLRNDFYNAKIYLDPLVVKFETKHEDGQIKGIIDDGKINIVGKNLSDTIISELTTLDQLEGGRFDFNAEGEIDDFNGTILMRDSLWTKTALYNNLLATLNTIPAILTLKNPGFSKSGFKIKRGAFDYRYKDGRLFFKKIVIEGYSAQITGKGSVNFKEQTIALKLQIHFLESLTNVLNKIPVAGYLIFGNDGTLAITLNVKGDLKDPEVNTEAAKDLIKAPLNILERTLTLPFKIFE